MNQWLRIKSQSTRRKVPPALPVPTISTSLMLQRKRVRICPTRVELAPAPPAQASFRVALWINRIKAFWTTNRSPTALPCFAWPTQQVIARSKEKPKKTSELTNPIFEIQFQGLPMGNNQSLFPFFDQLKPFCSATSWFAQTEVTRDRRPIRPRFSRWFTPAKGVTLLAKQGSSSGLDTKESKDCF